eukprot:SAG31_NODE_5352_length_2592_cov_12.708785_1_plen_169_part_10
MLPPHALDPDTENTQTPLVRKHTAEAEAAALELWRAVQSATGPQCYLAYHDGGYSNNKKTGEETAGWGYQLQKLMLHERCASPDLPVPNSSELAHGPVEVNPESRFFGGCLHYSNNTAELSAVPQILTRVLRERRRVIAQASKVPTTAVSSQMQYIRRRAAVPETLIMA